MLRLVVGKRARQRETACLGARVAAAREIEVHEVRAPEPGVPLDHEDRMAADNDWKRDSGQARDGAGPEAGRVADTGRVEAVARRGLDAGDAVASRADRHHLDALLDADAPPSRRRGIAGRDRGRVAVARLGLVEDGAEMLAVDPWLDARELAGLEHLGADAERPLASDRFLELGTHRGGDADQHAAVDVARLAADGVGETLEHGERPHDHLAGLWRGVELADDSDRAPGATGGEELALEEEDVARTHRRQMEGDGGARDAASDDDDLGVADHLDAAAVTSAASASSSRRTESPWRIEPGARTRAET